MAGTWKEEYDALSARIGATYDVAQSMGATGQMPAADQRNSWNLSSYVATIPVGGGQPYDALCEWIYASGNAYIDTGINLSCAAGQTVSTLQLSVFADIITDIPCNTTQASGNHVLFGFSNSFKVHGGWMGIRDCWAFSTGTTSQPSSGNGGIMELSAELSAYGQDAVSWRPDMPTMRLGMELNSGNKTNTLYLYKLPYNTASTVFWMNGKWHLRNLYTTTTASTAALLTTYNLRVFGGWQGSTEFFCDTPALKLKRLELDIMTTDGLKRMLLVPARKGSQYGMYDMISKQMFFNANSVGQLSGGPDIG